MKVGIKEVGKPLQIVETDEKYRGNCVRKYIGKVDKVEYIRVNGNENFSIGEDEDAGPLGKEINFLIETTDPVYPIQKVVGDVVFVRTKFADPVMEEMIDYEVIDLTDEDIIEINQMLDEELQERLKKEFVDYGKGTAYFIEF